MQVVTEVERTRAAQGDFGWVRDFDALSCYRGVWDEGRGSLPEQRGDQLRQSRSATPCFFLQYVPGGSLPAALELSARGAATAEAKRGRRPVWIGTAIATVTAVLAYVAVAAANHWWPF